MNCVTTPASTCTSCVPLVPSGRMNGLGIGVARRGCDRLLRGIDHRGGGQFRGLVPVERHRVGVCPVAWPQLLHGRPVHCAADIDDVFIRRLAIKVDLPLTEHRVGDVDVGLYHR